MKRPKITVQRYIPRLPCIKDPLSIYTRTLKRQKPQNTGLALKNLHRCRVFISPLLHTAVGWNRSNLSKGVVVIV